MQIIANPAVYADAFTQLLAGKTNHESLSDSTGQVWTQTLAEAVAGQTIDAGLDYNTLRSLSSQKLSEAIGLLHQGGTQYVGNLTTMDKTFSGIIGV